MSETFYKPLTPKLRNEIIESINNSIAELNTCEQNGLVKEQINAYEVFRKYINSFPDGYPIPFKK